MDSNTFWCLLWNPLFPYSLALMLCGLSVGTLALIHPYPVAYAAAIAAFHPLLKLHNAMGAMSGPSLAGILVGFGPGSGWNDARRSAEFWGTGVKFLFLESPPPAWLSAGAEKIFGNASVSVYRRR
ncbi:MAG: hypothetical protein KGL74_06250 [Elusimicrobia bacterium]|nr:hypothetical protein [Elusimicrobiota bacterium]